MRRWLANFVTGASLLMCVLFVALDIHSRWRVSWVVWRSIEGMNFVIADKGTISLSTSSIYGDIPPGIYSEAHPFEWRMTSPDDQNAWAKYGFEYSRHPGNGMFLMLPLWPLAILTALLPTLWLYRWYRLDQRLQPGHCRKCGYDLRGSPERCPECGTVAETANRAEVISSPSNRASS